MRRVASVGCAVSTSCSETPALELLRRDALEPREGVVERLGRDALLELVRAQAAHAMVLLGDVRELEVQPERPQHARLPLERQRLDRLLELVVRRAAARDARASARTRSTSASSASPSCSTSTRPEQVAEQADVAAQRRVCGLPWRLA